MKPKQAAAVIQKLPEETVFTIFDQLRPHQVTKIMENLPESYLAKLTQDRLNKYRNL
jgi:flagellar motility protein MotE (MotC chaperone)